MIYMGASNDGMIDPILCHGQKKECRHNYKAILIKNHSNVFEENFIRYGNRCCILVHYLFDLTTVEIEKKLND